MSRHVAMCTYRVKEGKDEEFQGHLLKHQPTLHKLGLLTDEPSLIFRGRDESGKSFFVEFLHWKSADGQTVAEQMPEVLAVWERLGSLVEARSGRPPMEFPFVEQIETG